MDLGHPLVLLVSWQLQREDEVVRNDQERYGLVPRK